MLILILGEIKLASIQIGKVSTLPSTFTPNKLYLVKVANSSLFDAFLANGTGTSVYKLAANSDITDIINNLRNIPNGIVGLNSAGIIDSIDGQDTELLHNGQPVWDDLMDVYSVKNLTGANNPSWGTVFSTCKGYIWSGNSMTEVQTSFHLNHQYALNTKIYPHIHWMPITTATGTVVWQMDIWAAARDAQFPASPTTVSIAHTVSVNSIRMNFVSEVSDADAILDSNLGPDSIIKMRIYRDPSHALDTFPDDIHSWQADLHYQKIRFGTKNKSPNFFA